MTVERFRAELLAEGPGGASMSLQLPFDAAAAFGSRARIAVRGTLNGFAFRTSIFPDGAGGHHMMVNRSMQAGARAKAGDSIAVEMEPDTAARRVVVPADLRQAFLRNKPARATFDKLSPSCRREYVLWLDEARKPETRARRLEKALAMLAAGKRLR